MKKYDYFDGIEKQTIYCGISDICENWDGGFIVTTAGEPVSEYMLQDSGDDEEISNICRAIEEGTPDEPTAEDIAYINDWLMIWGII